jgi:type IV conjugative transfer system coupling protein TraD
MINNYIRGGQIFLHKMRMLRQVWDKGLVVSLVIALFVTTYISYERYIRLDYSAGITYIKALASSEINKIFSSKSDTPITAVANHGIFKKEMYPSEVVGHRGFKNKYYEILSVIFKSIIIFASTMFGTFMAVIVLWTRFGKAAGEKDVIKGGKVLSAKEVQTYLKKHGQAGDFSVGGMPLVKDSETSHILITGTTGAGKTTCMYELLPQIRKKNQPAIVIDYTGTIVSKYYDSSRGDIVIGSCGERNIPEDQSHSWDFWKEVEDEHNLAIIANSLFADKGGGYDEMWNNASKQFFKDAVHATVAQAKTENTYPKMQDLYTLLARDKLAVVNKKLKGCASSAMLDPANDKTAMSIRTNTIAFIDWMENFIERENKCSITSWFELLRNDGTADNKSASQTGSWIFLRASPKERTTLRTFYSMLLDLSINRLMELGPDMDRRVWMIIDELPALKKLPSLSIALSEFRKYGGCVMASVQSPHQLFDIYGQNLAYSMLDQFNTKFIFRTDEHNFASYICKGFGEIEYKESSENFSYGAHEMRDGVSFTMLEKKKPILTSADLANLGNLEAYVKLPDPAIRLVKIKLVHH